MDGRTTIDLKPTAWIITRDDNIVLLGSCFSDSVGRCLADDGYNVTVNPAGPMFNPLSIARLIERDTDFTANDLYRDNNGIYHCLDYASRYMGEDVDQLLERVNATRQLITDALSRCTVLIVTFGSARVYDFNSTGVVAGNCHRLHPALFTERNLSLDEIVERWNALAPRLPLKTIYTVSPIRYTAHGLTANGLSKATLRVAADRLCHDCAEYFPSFEIMIDDLRDYKWYADDLKHPSPEAVAYIYDKFKTKYLR